MLFVIIKLQLLNVSYTDLVKKMKRVKIFFKFCIHDLQLRRYRYLLLSENNGYVYYSILGNDIY